MSDTMKTVEKARKIDRPNTRQFIAEIYDDFMEMHGV